MARVAFSVRFPAELAEALDRIAARGGYSRSDLVETLIGDVDAEDHEAIVKTPVLAAPTDKRNLRLSPDTLRRLNELAGDLPAADFLRRTIAYAVRMAPPEWRQEAAAPGTGDRLVSSRQRRSFRARQADVEGVEASQVHGSAVGLVVVAVLLILGALVSFIVWLLTRRPEPPSPGPGNDRRGQLPDGPAETPGV